MLVFRWLLNLVFFGFPWTFISQVMFAWNVLFNAKWNFLWAGGNVYLMANTAYVYIQTWMSIATVYELPIYMRHFKFFRLISWCSAVLYNFLFFASLIDFILLLFVYDKKTFDIFYLMEAMMFGYNFVLHYPITMVNWVIIFKELSLELFSLSAKRHGHNIHIALGLYDVFAFWATIFDVINPLNYLKWARKEIYNKLYKKYVMSDNSYKSR